MDNPQILLHHLLQDLVERDISEWIDNKLILLHHLLQEYLVERDVNYISVYQSCLLQMFSLVMYWKRVCLCVCGGGGGGG